jgi:hypothetical protein
MSVEEARSMKKPTKKQLSIAGSKLRNPHTPERKESYYARRLRSDRKRGR